MPNTKLLYKYLKEKGTMDRYTDRFHISEVFVIDYNNSKHYVIKCDYVEGDKIYLKYRKNVHLAVDVFNTWLQNNRLAILNKIL